MFALMVCFLLASSRNRREKSNMVSQREILIELADVLALDHSKSFKEKADIIIPEQFLDLLHTRTTGRQEWIHFSVIALTVACFRILLYLTPGYVEHWTYRMPRGANPTSSDGCFCW